MNKLPNRSVGFSILICAGLTVVLILAQFLMAGLSMFQNPAIWRCHVVAGFSLGLPIALMLFATAQQRLWPLSALIGVVAVSYIIQFSLILATKHGLGITWQALHPFNGSLMLSAAVLVLIKSFRLMAPRAGPSRIAATT
jgi:Family of unknown function (DUF6220)